ncbi:hypothetical protein DFH07DRAFT_1008370 [Mycena maculata]|uniref:Uncharacterized protein n=1 Tax=Mycena maculata TaxID=230809 RepID=A0AAD7HHM9_9AGAR|nr:hypothetical protein DFH07DRAFT_1008370 [Mycena maculata]
MSQYTSITGTAYANVRALKDIHLVFKTVQELTALAMLDGLDTRDWSSQTAVTWVLLELSRAAFTTVCTSPSFSVNRTYHVSNNLQWFSGSLYYWIPIASQVATCFASSFDDPLPVSDPIDKDIRNSLNQTLVFVERTKSQPFMHAVQNHLCPHLQRFTSQRHSRQRSIADLGSCWIALSCTIFDLFVPDAPVDPAAIQNCATGFWKQQESLLREQIILHSHAEYLTTGNLENVVIDCLREQLEEVLGRLRVIPALPLRDKSKIDALISLLGNSEEKNNIRAREDVYKAEKGNVSGGRDTSKAKEMTPTARASLLLPVDWKCRSRRGTALLNKLNPKYKSMMNEYVNDCGQHTFNCIQDVEFSLEVKGSEKLNEDWISMHPVDDQIKNIEYKIRHTWF